MADNMKIVVLLGDGMADYPVASLGERTPLDYAHTPNMDKLAGTGILGMVRTVPSGMSPGSDTANLAIFGYDPARYYTGRAPLEALNMNIRMGTNDVAFRCNTITVDDGILSDFSADHIESDFTRVLIEEAARKISIPGIEFYPGVSYRNIVIWRNYPHENITETTPPHDIQGRPAKEYLPAGPGSEVLRRITTESEDLIRSSEPVRQAKTRYRGNPTTLWLWGGGRRPAMETMKEKYGLQGCTISAVDLIHGIGRAAGLEPLPVPGATGYIDTDYTAKTEALLRAIGTTDFVYLHVESPDESGHEGNLEHKIRSIEDFDLKVVGPVIEGMRKYDNYCILLMPDHPTPLSLRTHTDEPVPFIAYRSRGWTDPALERCKRATYSEASARETGLYVPEGHRLIEYILKGWMDSKS